MQRGSGCYCWMDKHWQNRRQHFGRGGDFSTLLFVLAPCCFFLWHLSIWHHRLWRVGGATRKHKRRGGLIWWTLFLKRPQKHYSRSERSVLSFSPLLILISSFLSLNICCIWKLKWLCGRTLSEYQRKKEKIQFSKVFFSFFGTHDWAFPGQNMILYFLFITITSASITAPTSQEWVWTRTASDQQITPLHGRNWLD